MAKDGSRAVATGPGQSSDPVESPELQVSLILLYQTVSWSSGLSWTQSEAMIPRYHKGL